MKKFYVSFLLTVALLSSCVTNRVIPSSEFVTFEIACDHLNSIDVSSSITVLFKQSDTTKVTVECPDNIKELLDINASDGRLSAGFVHAVTIDGNCNVTITVNAPSLNRIDASASSRFEISKGLYQAGPLDIDASSSARVVITGLETSELSVDASSSSQVKAISVKTGNADIDCSSSANVSISEFICGNINAEASSAAHISLDGTAENAWYDASSAASINARHMIAEELKHAKASSAANIECAAKKQGTIEEQASGNVRCI